jgi:6-phosphogluconolactonase (cycloisomerase 2 family)
MTVWLPAMLGCGSGKFFVPTCQQTNSCGGGSTSYSSYTYVANQTIGTLGLLPIPKKTFSSLTSQTITLGTPPSALAATPKGTFLYVATNPGPIFVYSIGSNGALTLGNNGSYVATTLLPVSMAIDPSGQWLFLVSQSISTLLEYQIDPSTGALTPVGQGTPLDIGSPTQVYVTPDDKNVYVGIGTGGIDGFAFNSTTGALSNGQHYATKGGAGSSVNALAADNNSAFLFAGETGSGIRAFSIGTNGALKEISGSPFSTQLGPKSIVVDPTNQFVYVASSTAGSITGYSMASSGALTQLSSSPFSTGAAPVAMSLDSTGAYLFVVCNGGSPDLQVFSFDASTPGKLDSVTTASTGTDPAGAISISIVPAGPPPTS